MRIRTIDTWLSGVVLAHLLITFVHGAAHRSAQVGLGLAGLLFVLIVIEVAPLAGLALAIAGRRAGGWLVASSMAASLLFGLINHFLIGGPDHVSSVAAGSRALFTSSAILLVLSEAAGVFVGARSAARPQEEWS
jgi:hypothetical protein